MLDFRVSQSIDLTSDVILYPGECLDLLSALPTGLAKLVITSPPYNIGKPYEKRLQLTEYLGQQEKVIRECVRILAADGSICWQVGNYVDNGEIVPIDILLYPLFTSSGMKLRNRIIWHFGHGLHCSRRFSGRYETILWLTKTDSYIFNLDAVRVPQKYKTKKFFKGPRKGELSCNPRGKNPTDVWEIPNVKSNHPEKTLHPCQFPVELVERFVLSLTNRGDYVVDPFIGVGSTAIASLLHGRKCVGAEVVSEYLRIAEDRLSLLRLGRLTTRPMGKPIYKPPSDKNHSIPLPYFAESPAKWKN